MFGAVEVALKPRALRVLGAVSTSGRVHDRRRHSAWIVASQSSDENVLAQSSVRDTIEAVPMRAKSISIFGTVSETDTVGWMQVLMSRSKSGSKKLRVDWNLAKSWMSCASAKLHVVCCHGADCGGVEIGDAGNDGSRNDCQTEVLLDAEADAVVLGVEEAAKVGWGGKDGFLGRDSEVMERTSRALRCRTSSKIGNSTPWKMARHVSEVKRTP